MENKSNEDVTCYLNEQYYYLDKKSLKYKRLYNIFIILEIFISGFIPFVTLFIEKWPGTKFIVAFMGSIVTILAALKGKFNLHDKWLKYRITHEKLKIEKFLFDTKTKPYNDENRISLFYEKASELMINLNDDWSASEKSIHITPMLSK